MFTSRHLVEWIENHIQSGATVHNDLVPPTGRIIYVRMSPGAGYDMEGIQDNRGFTLECRGADRNYDDAEYIASEVDQCILVDGAAPYEFLDGTYIYFIGRLGGSPSQLLIPDTAGRYAFTCNYFVTFATNL